MTTFAYISANPIMLPHGISPRFSNFCSGIGLAYDRST